nr:hypothetical protein [Tanacetum cinerariifolium]
MFKYHVDNSSGTIAAKDQFPQLLLKLLSSLRGCSSNNVEVKRLSGSLPYTNDQISKLMSLIGEKSNSGVQANMADSKANQHIISSTKNMTRVIDISDLNIIVGHPNGAIAKIRQVEILDLQVHTYDSSNRTELVSPDVVNTRRSSIVSKLPNKLNDYVLDDRVKYDLKRLADHTKLYGDNYCFISNLNKTDEPTCYNEVVKDINWYQAMNNEMKASYFNNTWVLTDLPSNRKVIGLYVDDIVITRNNVDEISMFKDFLNQEFKMKYLGIVYTKSGSRSVNAYADSEWAKCKMTRRLVSGYCVFVFDGLASWKSKKPATLSRSSMEAVQYVR